MLKIDRISKSYGIQTVLDAVSFVINRGDRVGLVGPNGSGKSTLLRIIAGEEHPDQGRILLSPEENIGYLPQGLDQPPETSVRSFLEEAVPGLNASRRDMARITVQMESAKGERLSDLVEQFGEAHTRFEQLGGYRIEHRQREVLSGLGLGHVPLDAPVSDLSGGQQTRMSLARLLLNEPTVLLLDEPTNHLDLEALEWLEKFLASFSGSVLIVSHDRVFLDRTVHRILALEKDTHELRAFPGNYTDYAQAAEQERHEQWSKWKDQQEEIRRLERDIHQTRSQAQKTEAATKDSKMRRYAKKVARKARAKEKRLKRFLASEDRLEKPKSGWGLKIEFGPALRSGQNVLQLMNIGYQYAGGPVLFQGVNLTIRYGERIALIGPNGSGKSTLMKIIAGDLDPTWGEVVPGANLQIGYMPQDQQTLPEDGNPLSVLLHTAPMCETEARNFLHYFLFAQDEVFTPIGQLSYGERSRLILAKLVAEGCNFLLLDEPINHLDIQSREQFEEALGAFPGTILAIVHDRAFIRRFSGKIWGIRESQVREHFGFDEPGFPEKGQ